MSRSTVDGCMCVSSSLCATQTLLARFPAPGDGCVSTGQESVFAEVCVDVRVCRRQTQHFKARASAQRELC